MKYIAVRFFDLPNYSLDNQDSWAPVKGQKPLLMVEATMDEEGLEIIRASLDKAFGIVPRDTKS